MIAERLKSLASLALSRKLWLAVSIPLLTIANRRWNLGLTEQEVTTASAAIIAAILGIAAEDVAQGKRVPSGGLERKT